MHFLTSFVASLGLLALPSTISASPIEERAAPTQYNIVVKSQQGSHKFDGKFLSFFKHGGMRIVLGPYGGTGSTEGEIFTVTKGSLHTTVPPNMVIASGEYSTGTITFGETIFLDQGKGSNDYVAVNKTNGLLTFKATQSGTPGDDSFRLCPLKNANGLSAIALGNAQTSGCVPVYLQTKLVK